MSDMTGPADLEIFQERLRTFIFDTIPAALAGVVGEVPRGLAFRGALHGAGLAGLTVPTRFGGQGLGPEFEQAYAQVAANRAMVDDKMFFLGINVILQSLIDLEETALATEFGPRMLRGDTIACQLFSEPEAGSDLASVRTKAVRTEGGWILDGQKVWTSYGHIAGIGLLLARTDPTVAKHRGLTMFLIDMDADGVEVRPLRQMTGESEFNEVFLGGAFVPDNRVVGGVGTGWSTTLTVLGHERLAVAKAGENTVRRPLPMARIVESVADGGNLDALLDAWMDERTASLVSRQIARRAQAGIPLGPETSLGKLLRTRNGLRAAKLAAEYSFDGGLAWNPGSRDQDLAFEILNAPGMAMGGGTDDIQRNTIGERILGLPREPLVKEGNTSK
ncbi:acyl-CoA dehydrogenase family protein [Rhodococcus sp. OK302]|uniref:acyl-CoA dehydrogenase family protein n=1 Tax=Rhodococcus sp. OK302 TaxID=1882769 RepID=UPI000B93B2A9|nr:acyl-CoA dehydrogenase family protein [Rhodococcus sp. OK302]OYD66653.1 acyl-CoA dehydrogenase [Rhodococcus sp. OK302]